MDKFSKAKRAEIMRAVKGKNTLPELQVRRLLHSMGFRFRLHRRDMPGCPDIVLPKHKICLFVHGCFWHQHPGCKRAALPSSNFDFWSSKFKKNVIRDKENIKKLNDLGWKVVIIWECETKNPQELMLRVKSILMPGEGLIV